MRVIPPSFEILTSLDNQSMGTRIESCGRICYKSEDKITEDSAGPFVKNILKRKHNSVAEMAVLTIKISCAEDGDIAGLFQAIPKYFVVDPQDNNSVILTGSVRAFRELTLFHSEFRIVKAISAYLAERYPQFYFDLIPGNGWEKIDGFQFEKIHLQDVDKMPVNLLAKHRHLAVKIITNRAVTHEIVRHRPVAYLQESQRYCRYDKEQFGNEVTFIKPMFYADDTPEYKLWEKAMLDTEKIYLELLKSSSPQAARTVLPNSCKTEIIVFANLLQWQHIFRLRTPPAAEPSMREIMIPLQAEFVKMFPAVFG